MTEEEATKKIKELEEYIKSGNSEIGFDKDKIFLLSAEEYEKYKDIIPEYKVWWWLRSPGEKSYLATVVDFVGLVYSYGHDVDSICVCVRPAIKIDTDFEIGHRICMYDFPWIYLGDGTAIAEVPIATHIFDERSNDYEKSEIRQFLLEWLDERARQEGKKLSTETKTIDN